MSVTEREREGDEDEERQKAQRHKGRAWETRGQLFSHTLISKQTSHSRNTSDNFVVCLTFSQFSHFSEHFFYTPFTGASAASTCPSSCPWGLIPQHQFVLEEDRGLAFIHPSVAPNSNLSDLLSVWHLTPLCHWNWFTCMPYNRGLGFTCGEILCWAWFTHLWFGTRLWISTNENNTDCYVKQGWTHKV